MQSDIPGEITSAIQSASIKRHPSPRHDLNPSTAASAKQPVYLDDNHSDVDSDMAHDQIPISVLNPIPRKQTMPPLPDLRFEQSYLKSIEQEIRKQVNEAADFAEQTPEPEPAELYTDVLVESY